MTKPKDPSKQQKKTKPSHRKNQKFASSDKNGDNTTERDEWEKPINEDEDIEQKTEPTADEIEEINESFDPSKEGKVDIESVFYGEDEDEDDFDNY